MSREAHNNGEPDRQRTMSREAYNNDEPERHTTSPRGIRQTRTHTITTSREATNNDDDIEKPDRHGTTIT
eukprot:scaffold17604_cov65-Cyclotella_meneghiniana.AAC.2